MAQRKATWSRTLVTALRDLELDPIEAGPAAQIGTLVESRWR